MDFESRVPEIESMVGKNSVDAKRYKIAYQALRFNEALVKNDEEGAIRILNENNQEILKDRNVVESMLATPIGYRLVKHFKHDVGILYYFYTVTRLIEEGKKIDSRAIKFLPEEVIYEYDKNDQGGWYKKDQDGNRIVTQKLQDFIINIITSDTKYGYEIFEDVPEELKNNKEFIKSIIKGGEHRIFQYISQELSRDECFIKECCDVDIRIIRYLDKSLIYNKEDQVRQEYKDLIEKYIMQKKDKQYLIFDIINAIPQDFASELLSKVKKDKELLSSMPNSITDEKSLYMFCHNYQGYKESKTKEERQKMVLEYITEGLCSDNPLEKIRYIILGYLDDPDITNDADFMGKLVRLYPPCTKYADKNILRNQADMQYLSLISPYVMQYAYPSLITSKSILRIMDSDPDNGYRVFKILDRVKSIDNICENIEEFLIKSYKKDYRCFQYMVKNFNLSGVFIRDAIKHEFEIAKFISPTEDMKEEVNEALESWQTQKMSLERKGRYEQIKENWQNKFCDVMTIETLKTIKLNKFLKAHQSIDNAIEKPIDLKEEGTKTMFKELVESHRKTLLARTEELEQEIKSLQDKEKSCLERFCSKPEKNSKENSSESYNRKASETKHERKDSWEQYYIKNRNEENHSYTKM